MLYYHYIKNSLFGRPMYLLLTQEFVKQFTMFNIVVYRIACICYKYILAITYNLITIKSVLLPNNTTVTPKEMYV